MASGVGGGFPNLESLQAEGIKQVGHTTIQNITNYGTNAIGSVKSFFQASEGDGVDHIAKLATAIFQISAGLICMETARTLSSLPIPFIGLAGTALDVAAIALIGYAIFVNVLPLTPGYVGVYAQFPEIAKGIVPAPSGHVIEAMHQDIEQLTTIEDMKQFMSRQSFSVELGETENRPFKDLQNLLDTAYKAKLHAEKAKRNYELVSEENTSAKAKYYVELVKARFGEIKACLYLKYPDRCPFKDVVTEGFDVDDEVIAILPTNTIEKMTYLTVHGDNRKYTAQDILRSNKLFGHLAEVTKKDQLPA